MYGFARGSSVLAVAALLISIAGCTENEPSSVEELGALEFAVALEPTGIANKPILKVEGVPIDSKRDLSGSQVPVMIETTGGDAETATLATGVCQDPSGAEYVCNEFLVGMDSGLDVRSLEPHVDEVDGRLRLLLSCDAGGDCEVVSTERAVVVIFSGQLDSAMTVAEGWAGVRHVDRNGVVRTTLETDEELIARLPLDFAEAVPGDGRVQVGKDETIRVKYDGPEGQSVASLQI